MCQAGEWGIEKRSYEGTDWEGEMVELPPSVCLSVPVVLCFLTFGLSLLVSSSVSSFSAVSLFFSRISLSSISLLFSVLFSVSMFHFSVTYSCFCVFSIPSYSFMYVCLSPSLLSSYPIPTAGEWAQGVQKKRKWTQGIKTPGCQRAKAKHPALSFNL